MTPEEIKEILSKHSKWGNNESGGGRANLSGAYLGSADLRSANLSYANLRFADLSSADLRSANLRSANLRFANLRSANLSSADLSSANLCLADLRYANLSSANLSFADLRSANLRSANLRSANLSYANLSSANLSFADLRSADLSSADLIDARNLIKIMGVEIGNFYWKRFNTGMCNNDYQFFIGINELRDGEIFAADDRVTCSYPGFHFASRSWCATNYSERQYEARIRIPEGAQINEPWATDGKASADKIEILQVFDTKTGEDVTENFRRTT
jgi:hypothetical protein